VRYWHPLREVVYFKRHVYAQALEELAPLLYPEGAPLLDTVDDAGAPAPPRHPGGQHDARPRLAPAGFAGSMRQRRR
jgi:hypothetical protein